MSNVITKACTIQVTQTTTVSLRCGITTQNVKNNKSQNCRKKKKFAVYVKNESGTVVIVRFGDPNMEIKRDDDNRRKNFRARHNCDDPGPKWKARYWSCYQWRAGAKVDS